MMDDRLLVLMMCTVATFKYHLSFTQEATQDKRLWLTEDSKTTHTRLTAWPFNLQNLSPRLVANELDGCGALLRHRGDGTAIILEKQMKSCMRF